ncbi:MAG: tetratricopeptide repeat protein [Planctomycetota bacterium]|nr:tetratricopeptide repeat protein [Planctomycetota bacterium]MDA1261441.1 tetratricopeptide repeat protein [Planctomycetota bacterium]
MSNATIKHDNPADPAAAKSYVDLAVHHAVEGRREEAVHSYRKALESDRSVATLFALAKLLDRIGDDQEAIDLYEEICYLPMPPVNALINLAVLYEDMGELQRAERCLRSVLSLYPNHAHARMYLKDVCAVKTMTYDANAEQQAARRNAILDTPITDFELSARARNCLKKVEIRTLGDLLRVTEAELMAFKNFGETSINEIKSMLNSRGLRLGQGLEGGFEESYRREYLDQLRLQVAPELLDQPISSLELTIRAKKAVQLLEVRTLGELACRTEAELMGMKNFGLTSLDEIKAQLATHGLSLRVLE